MDANLVPIVAGIIATIPGAVALYLQFRREKHKEPLEDASQAVDTAKSASEALRGYSEEIRNLRKAQDELRLQMATYQTQLDAMREENESKDRLLEQWAAGIRRLIAQLVSLNVVPVWQPDPLPEKKQN